MHQGLAGVLYSGKVTGLTGFSSMYYIVRHAIMSTYCRAYYEIDADETYQSHKLRAALSSVGALGKLLFSEM